MSQFTFLQPEWPGIFEDAGKAAAAAAAHADPRTACFYARRAQSAARHFRLRNQHFRG